MKEASDNQRRRMKMKAVPILILVGGLVILACWMTADSRTLRQKEWAAVLKPLLKPASGSFWSEDEEQSPGWRVPENRQAVRDFIAKYPETEEAYQAEVWLAVGAYSEGSLDRSAEKRRQAEVVERLAVISHTTTLAGTRKMAELERAFRLYQDEPGGHAEFYRQVDAILSRIEDFNSEKDRAFRTYLKVVELRAGDIEPTLRLLVANEKGYDGHLDQGLELAKELKHDFPHWEPQSVNGLIEMDELYLRGLSKN